MLTGGFVTELIWLWDSWSYFGLMDLLHINTTVEVPFSFIYIIQNAYNLNSLGVNQYGLNNQ